MSDSDPRRPADHVDAPHRELDARANLPRLGLRGYLRFAWRQLTSMRTALFLLLLLALAAIPGSLVPQRAADPNGVAQYRTDHPALYPVLDHLQVFDTFTSVWFSAVYLLLFVSLIGCIIPRLRHHVRASRTQPPRTPNALRRLSGYQRTTFSADESELPAADFTPELALRSAERLLRKSGYRVARFGTSVSAERGYLRETGNIAFHSALLLILVAVGVGGGFGYTGQRLLVEGQTFTNVLGSYDSFNPGRWFDPKSLPGYSLKLDKFETTYEERNLDALGQPVSYDATMTTIARGQPTSTSRVGVNSPLSVGGAKAYILGNGYAVRVTVRNADGTVAFQDSVPFLPQDSDYTSVGVIKVPDASTQLGIQGFFYPTAVKQATGAYASAYPDVENPMLSLQVYAGDLGLDDGTPRSVYQLDTKGLTEIAGRKAAHPSVLLKPGQRSTLPDGAGSIEFDGVQRYVSLDIHHDPAQVWVGAFVAVAVAGLLMSLVIPRRRLWVKVVEIPGAQRNVFEVEYAGLARGEDPNLERALATFALRHRSDLSLRSTS